MSAHTLPQGRVAVVTGAASGIGKAVAWRLAGESYNVTVLDWDQGEAESAAQGLRDAGLSATVAVADVTDPESVREAIAGVEGDFHRLDVVVNCAGVNRFLHCSEVTDDLWKQIIDVNLTGSWNVTRAAMHLLRLSPAGRVVNIGSAAGVLGIPLAAPYTAAKHGIVGLTRALAIDLGPDGVTVNCVCPGPVSTPLADRATSPAFMAQAAERIPLGRVGTPDDVAVAVAFFAGTSTGWITGTVLPVDGGLVSSVRSRHWE